MLFFTSVIILSVLGLDRIDLFFGTGPFVLTPFLAISPIFIFLYLLNVLFKPNSSSIIKDYDNPVFLITLGLLIIILAASALFSNDLELSAKRLALLLYQLSFVIIALHSWNKKTLVIGACSGLLIFTLFNIVTIINWVSLTTGFLEYIDLGPSFSVSSIGGLAPRLSGYSRDPNQGVFIVCVYFYILYKYGRKSDYYLKLLMILSILSIFFSLSKSGILGFLAMYFGFFIMDKKDMNFRSMTKLIMLSVIIISTTITVVTIKEFGEYAYDITKILNAIFTTEEGSSGSIHLLLLSKGIDIVFSDAKNFIIGNGLLASTNILSDFFLDDKYANFHSIYISFLAESGFFSFLLFIILLFYPLLAKSKDIPLILLIAAFGIFYLMHLSPMFWFAIGLIWKNLKRNENILKENCRSDCDA